MANLQHAVRQRFVGILFFPSSSSLLPLFGKGRGGGERRAPPPAGGGAHGVGQGGIYSATTSMLSSALMSL